MGGGGLELMALMGKKRYHDMINVAVEGIEPKRWLIEGGGNDIFFNMERQLIPFVLSF